MLAGLCPVYLFFHLLDDTFTFPQIVNDPAALAVNKSFLKMVISFAQNQ